MLRFLSAFIAALLSVAVRAAPTITAPATAKMGSEIAIQISGAKPADFVSIVPKGSAEGTYEAYQYTNKPAVKLRVPAASGEYEIRVLGEASPYPTLARRALVIEAVTATLDAPDQVAAGAEFQVRWTGPGNAQDYIGIGEAKAGGQPYISYAYAGQRNPITLTAPDQAGQYELRYFLGERDRIIARKPITVGKVSASLAAPPQAIAGSSIKVNWQGPGNPQDFITIVKAGAPEKTYATYVYTSKKSPATLPVPDQPGDYELRYLSGQGYLTLAQAKIKVTPATALVQPPAEGVAGTTTPIKWQGPNNAQDYVAVARKGSPDASSNAYSYTTRGNPAQVVLPLEPGEYEVRYVTGQSHAVLARAPMSIKPGQLAPGSLIVTSDKLIPAGNAVEVILDASGSMLQRLGNQRRIDIAKQTLAQLTTQVIPAGTPFAFRVFGREVDSCQTDLDIPLGPLSPASVSARINALEAKNGAKTPIGASLEKVSSDLASAKGERLVILLTDGEETCGGDPAATIQSLRKAGTQLRVSIVGFAIDDQKLAATFRHWSEMGGGVYFDAKDAASLNKALADALRPTFEVANAQGQVIAKGVVGGAAVKVLAGNHTLRVNGQSAGAKPVVVKPGETTSVKL